MKQALDIITDLGDSALLLPASVLLVGYLLYLKSTRAATIWVTTLALCAGLTLALKVCFYACGTQISLPGLRSPSGHASLSAMFYGCSALMITANKDRGTQFTLLAASIALVVAIAMSRVVLHVHTVSEVVAGLSVGAFCVAWFGSRYLAHPPLSLPWRPAVAVLAIIALGAHGWHWDLEGLIHNIAQIFRSSVPVCV